MPKTRPPLSPEFRRQMVDLVHARRDPTEHPQLGRQANRQEGRQEENREVVTSSQPRGAGSAAPGNKQLRAWSATSSLERPPGLLARPARCRPGLTPSCRRQAAFSTSPWILDAWSRKIVGWSMANHLRTELVLDGVGDGDLGQRRPGDVIHDSDQGEPVPRRFAFGKRCREARGRPSMGSVGDAYDNAMCESPHRRPLPFARNDVLRPAPSSITAGPGFQLASLVCRWRRCFFRGDRYEAAPLFRVSGPLARRIAPAGRRSKRLREEPREHVPDLVGVNEA